MFEMDNTLFKSHKTSVIVAWSLRIFLILFGIYEIFVGFPIYGIMILIAVSIILLPSISTRRHIFIPLELEILFLLIVTLEYVIAIHWAFMDDLNITISFNIHLSPL